MSSSVRARPRRRLDDVRRPQILETAVELVREKGLWDVRISDVAERAGLSPASVVYYFGTKDQLFAQAIAGADDAFYAPLREELARLEPATERLACLIVRSSVSDWMLWIDLWVYARHHPETAAAQRRFHERWREILGEVIRHGCATGEWAAAEPDDAALRLSALTDGLAVHMVLGDPGHTRERYVAMTLAAAALELGCPAAMLEAAAEGFAVGRRCPPTAGQDRGRARAPAGSRRSSTAATGSPPGRGSAGRTS